MSALDASNVQVFVWRQVVDPDAAPLYQHTSLQTEYQGKPIYMSLRRIGKEGACYLVNSRAEDEALEKQKPAVYSLKLDVRKINESYEQFRRSLNWDVFRTRAYIERNSAGFVACLLMKGGIRTDLRKNWALEGKVLQVATICSFCFAIFSGLFASRIEQKITSSLKEPQNGLLEVYKEIWNLREICFPKLIYDSDSLRKKIPAASAYAHTGSNLLTSAYGVSSLIHGSLFDCVSFCNAFSIASKYDHITFWGRFSSWCEEKPESPIHPNQIIQDVVVGGFQWGINQCSNKFTWLSRVFFVIALGHGALWYFQKRLLLTKIEDGGDVERLVKRAIKSEKRAKQNSRKQEAKRKRYLDLRVKKQGWGAIALVGRVCFASAVVFNLWKGMTQWNAYQESLDDRSAEALNSPYVTVVKIS